MNSISSRFPLAMLMFAALVLAASATTLAGEDAPAGAPAYAVPAGTPDYIRKAVHNAAAGSGTRDTKKLHRIDPAIIRQEVTAAGFELVEESKLLAHPADDHTKMVFAPGLRGLTDQSVFKFRKPAK